MTDKQKTHAALPLSFLAFSVLLTVLCLGFCLLAERMQATKEIRTEVRAPQGITVILDPGHGGEDGGASGGRGPILEKHLNLAIANNVASYLRMNGVSVICTRTEDIMLYDKNADYKGRKKILDLAARLKISRETENSVFVSIHMNAFPKTQYSGLQVYYSQNDPRSSELATLIQNRTKILLQPKNNRKIKGACGNIYLLDRMETPAVLVECGFLSNAEECEKLSDPNYQKQLSLVLADAILQFVNDAS